MAPNKPVNRSKLRLFLGKRYFTWKRYVKWKLSSDTLSKVDTTVHFENVLVEHRSTLVRKLKDVDLQLQYNKVTNLQLAAERINGVVIKPGETFSVWRMVGKTSRSNGYLEGLTLVNGKMSKGVGGGLCQLGNLLYWMTLHTPLTITERWRHGYDVFPDINRTIPFACGATLSYNYVDLQLRNNTNCTFQISLWLDDEYLRGKITCNEQLPDTYQVVETDHRFVDESWGGQTRRNKIWQRITSRNDGTSRDVLVTENSAIVMY